jgi:drug/metabolite transporter (DMT)-like permease
MVGYRLIGVYVSLVLVQCSFALYSVLTKAALNTGMDPGVFVLLRDVTCAITLLIVGRRRAGRWIWPSTEDKPAFFYLGVCGLYFGQFFVVIGLQHSTPVVAATWSNSVPVFTYLLGLILKTEQLSFDTSTCLKLTGLGLAVGGSIDATVHHSGGDTHAGNSLIASLCFFLQVTFGGAVFWHLQKKLLNRYPAMQVASWYYSYGTAILVLVVLPSATSAQQWSLGRQDLVALGYAVLLWPSAAFALTYANESATPVTVMIFAPVQIVAATVLEYFFHGVVPTASRVVGSAAVILGLISFVAGRAMEAPSKSDASAEGEIHQAPGALNSSPEEETGGASYTDHLLSDSKQAI